MGSSHRGLRRVASFLPYTSKQVGDTGPAESTRRGNLQRVWSSFSGLAGHPIYATFGAIKAVSGLKTEHGCIINVPDPDPSINKQKNLG